MSDADIGSRFGISFATLSEIVIKKRGAGWFSAAAVRKLSKLGPDEFHPERTTVWSFRSRGNWATHNGSYRGNWSPYIPRNLLLRYSSPGDMVMDCFAGSGTTAVESLLLGRNFIGFDINPVAVKMAGQALGEVRAAALEKGVQPIAAELSVNEGDARRLSALEDSSIDLICTHPPYAGIIRYSQAVPGDLSSLDPESYTCEMKKVVEESRRVLRRGGRCAVLIGDRRKEKRNVPLGFTLIELYLRNGFELLELIVKRQFNTRTSGLWYNKAVQGRFLLLEHEYLPVFRKGKAQLSMLEPVTKRRKFSFRLADGRTDSRKTSTGTVWDDETGNILHNIERLSGNQGTFILKAGRQGTGIRRVNGAVYTEMQAAAGNTGEMLKSREMLQYAVSQLAAILEKGALLCIRAADRRIDGTLFPVGLLTLTDMHENRDFRLREIVVIDGSRKTAPRGKDGAMLRIAHSYLMIYERA